MPFTAPLKNGDEMLLYQLTFCCFQNVLQMPAGSLPIRVVRREEQEYEDMGFYGQKIRNSILRSAGLPIGIQVTAPFMRDEECVGAMWQLERLFPGIPDNLNMI